MSKSEALDRILKLVAQVARRIRLQNIIEGLVTGGTIAILWVAFSLVLYKTGWFQIDLFYVLCIVAAIIPIGSAVYLASRRLSNISLAQRLDRTHKLHDRLSTAVSLSKKNDESEWALSQIRDAAQHATKMDVAKASPFTRPLDIIPFGIALFALCGLFFYQAPNHQHELPVEPVIAHNPILDSASLTFEKEKLAALKKALEVVDDKASNELVKEVEELLKAVEEKQISEKQFLDRIAEIQKKFEAQIDKQKQDDIEKLANALKKAAEELEKSASKELKGNKDAQALIKALKKKNLGEASKALEKLAKKFMDPNMSDKELEKLAKLMEKFSDLIDPDDPGIKKLMEKHRRTLEKLARKMKKNKKGELSAKDKQKLDRAQKAMKKLQDKIDKNKNNKTKRKLERLKRLSKQIGEKGKANKKKRKNGRKASKPEDRKNFKNEAGRNSKKMSKDMEESSKGQKRDKARDMARKQLDDLKESMKRSRQSKGGKSKESQKRGKQMKDYLDRAKGKKRGEGKNGKGKKPQNVKRNGNGQGKGHGKGKGKRDLKTETKMKSKKTDVKVAGEKRSGATRSEIIKAASEKGFANTAYKDVFDDYESVVEEVMEKEKIPPGYRYYIKQYFKIIQPKEE